MKKEEKQVRFKRLASSRTTDILNRLRILSNCANRSSYDYTEEEINKIYMAIEKALKESRSKFYFPEYKDGFRF